MNGIPNCVPEYFREQREREDHEWELEQERLSYYEKNKAYRKQKQKDGCAELDFYPAECEHCSHGEEAPSQSEIDDIPTMICSNWKQCQVFRREMAESFPNVSWEEIVNWFTCKKEEDTRTEFKLRFKAKYGDYEVILRTTEPYTESGIRNLIDIHAMILSDAGHEDYTPVDILDRICEDKGWNWEDMDWQEMVIDDWDLNSEE